MSSLNRWGQSRTWVARPWEWVHFESCPGTDSPHRDSQYPSLKPRPHSLEWFSSDRFAWEGTQSDGTWLVHVWVHFYTFLACNRCIDTGLTIGQSAALLCRRRQFVFDSRTTVRWLVYVVRFCYKWGIRFLKFNVNIYILSLYFYNSIKFTDCILIKQFHFYPNREKCCFFLFSSPFGYYFFVLQLFCIVFCFVFL